MASERVPLRKGTLELEDGSRFEGHIFGSEKNSDGEVVFNTGMVGYVESLTDPSYRGQILAFTYPLIGNYGVPDFQKGNDGFESDEIQVRGVVVANYIEAYSHYEAETSLGDWLKSQGIVGITDIDTRRLTKILREKGTMLGRIVLDDDLEKFNVADPNATHLVAEVSTNEPIKHEGQDKGAHVVVVDCGVKRSIVNELVSRGCTVTVIPHDGNFHSIDCDGIMLSNGPGDPEMCQTAIKNLKTVLERDRPIPVAGICLGSQLMALAAGGTTFKLPYGHRSQNQPCREVGTEKCVITSQNHGYAVDKDSMPEGWEVWYENLNDGTVEGIRHSTRPFFAVQFHPEASPGPTDSVAFFDRFVEVVRNG